METRLSMHFACVCIELFDALWACASSRFSLKYCTRLPTSDASLSWRRPTCGAKHIDDALVASPGRLNSKPSHQRSSSAEIRLRHINADARLGVSIVLCCAAQAPLRAPLPEEALALAFLVAVLARLAEALGARATDLDCLPDALLHFVPVPSEPAVSFAAAICKHGGEGAGLAPTAELPHLSLIRAVAHPGQRRLSLSLILRVVRPQLKQGK